MRCGLPYRFRRALGRRLRLVKTCRTRPCREAGSAWFIRSRPWYAPGLIALSNRYLSWTATGVTILPTHLWLAWEGRLHTELSGLTAERAGPRHLRLPRISGEPLAAILARPAPDRRHPDRALQLAATALVQAHQHGVLWPEGGSRPFSHGDATVRNVLCDLASGRATWIDFETLHDPRRTTAWRQADDFRALIWSAAETTAAEAYEAVCAAVLACVSDPAILSELARLAGNGSPPVYHLAQASLSAAQHRRLCRALAAAIARPGAVEASRGPP